MFKKGVIREFERYLRFGFVEKESFLKEVEWFRSFGFKRIIFKIGVYLVVEFVMVLRFGVEVKFDLIIIDGVSGGIGMSLWLMMNEWGILIFYLEVLVY